MNNDNKPVLSEANALVPHYRFPQFKTDGNWKTDVTKNLIHTISPPKKLNSNEYLKEGKYPIVDQSKSFYCGYSNDESGLISSDKDFIIFGDHTCITKYLNHPFIQGADGIKIFSTMQTVLPKYLYQYLQHRPVKQEEYKRHFSILKEKLINYPNSLAEQQKIATCLSSLDDVIARNENKLAVLVEHKNGLMQNLFPKKNETQPKYRFPEFADDGDWFEKKLGEVAYFFKGKGISKSDITEDGLIPCIRYGELYTTYGETILNVKSKTNINKSDLFFSKKNDVIIPSSGETQIDIATASCVMLDNIALGGDLNVIRTEINGVFLSYLLNSTQKLEISKMAQGNAVVHLYNYQLASLSIKYPVPSEQKKIAEILISIDVVIGAQREKIDALKEHKRGLMQGLFPKIKS
jgi:type I restriction enzyme S subunit